MQVLIVDEVGMVSGELFQCLEEVLSTVRGKAPFGGVQVVLSGDFFQ